MARTRPTGSGGGSPTHHGHHGRRHKGRHPRVRRPHMKRRHAHTPAPRGPIAEPVSARSVWPHGAAAPGAIPPLATLDAATPDPPDPLALTGATLGAIHDTFTAWARQRDQALNRLSRRPGGLTRLAGL